MTMQLKFNNRNTTRQSIAKKMIKFLIACLIFIVAIFLLDKFNFPSPKKNLKEEITNEIIKLK